ncbi:hypothetical protein QYM36_005385, partial [Artemia franciscana]
MLPSIFVHVVPKLLSDLIIKLLKRAKRTFRTGQWETAILRLSQIYSIPDTIEFESHGFAGSSIGAKVRLLKYLVETSLDNPGAGLKAEILRLGPEGLRFQPIGRDKHGRKYWYIVDTECNIWLYMEDEDDEKWELLARDRESVSRVIENLVSETETIVKENTSESVSPEDTIDDTQFKEKIESDQRKDEENIGDAEGSSSEVNNKDQGGSNSDKVDNDIIGEEVREPAVLVSGPGRGSEPESGNQGEDESDQKKEVSAVIVEDMPLGQNIPASVQGTDDKTNVDQSDSATVQGHIEAQCASSEAETLSEGKAPANIAEPSQQLKEEMEVNNSSALNPDGSKDDASLEKDSVSIDSECQISKVSESESISNDQSKRKENTVVEYSSVVSVSNVENDPSVELYDKEENADCSDTRISLSQNDDYESPASSSITSQEFQTVPNICKSILKPTASLTGPASLGKTQLDNSESQDSMQNEKEDPSLAVGLSNISSYTPIQTILGNNAEAGGNIYLTKTETTHMVCRPKKVSSDLNDAPDIESETLDESSPKVVNKDKVSVDKRDLELGKLSDKLPMSNENICNEHIDMEKVDSILNEKCNEKISVQSSICKNVTDNGGTVSLTNIQNENNDSLGSICQGKIGESDEKHAATVTEGNDNERVLIDKSATEGNDNDRVLIDKSASSKNVKKTVDEISGKTKDLDPENSGKSGNDELLIRSDSLKTGAASGTEEILCEMKGQDLKPNAGIMTYEKGKDGDLKDNISVVEPDLQKTKRVTIECNKSTSLTNEPDSSPIEKDKLLQNNLESQKSGTVLLAAKNDDVNSGSQKSDSTISSSDESQSKKESKKPFLKIRSDLLAVSNPKKCVEKSILPKKKPTDLPEESNKRLTRTSASLKTLNDNALIPLPPVIKIKKIPGGSLSIVGNVKTPINDMNDPLDISPQKAKKNSNDVTPILPKG